MLLTDSLLIDCLASFLLAPRILVYGDITQGGLNLHVNQEIENTFNPGSQEAEAV